MNHQSTNFDKHLIDLTSSNLNREPQSSPVTTLRRLLATFATLAMLAFSTIVLADLPVMFSKGSVNLPPPGSMMAAGYVDIKNESDKDMRIVSASSDAFKKVELHLTKMHGDVAKMRKQDFLDIKAGSTLELKHGAHHLMLMGMIEPLIKGQVVSITFTTEDGKEHEAELLVE